MLYKRLEQANVVKTNGETIYELMTQNDVDIYHNPLGIAVADIKKSKLHFHNKTHEVYYVLEGFGSLEMIDERGQRYDVPLEKGVMQYIPPKVKYVAHAATLEEYPEIDVPLNVLVISCPPWTPEDDIKV